MATLVAAVALTAATYLIPQDQPLANILTTLNFALYAPHYLLSHEESSWSRGNNATPNIDTNFSIQSTDHIETSSSNNTFEIKIQEVFLINDEQDPFLTNTFEIISRQSHPHRALPGRDVSVTIALGEDYVPAYVASNVPTSTSTSTSTLNNSNTANMLITPPPTPVIPEINISGSEGWLTIIKAIFDAVLVSIESLRPFLGKFRIYIDLIIFLCATVPIYLANILWGFVGTFIADHWYEFWLVPLLLAPWAILLSFDARRDFYQQVAPADTKPIASRRLHILTEPLKNAIFLPWLRLMDKLSTFIEGLGQWVLDRLLTEVVDIDYDPISQFLPAFVFINAIIFWFQGSLMWKKIALNNYVLCVLYLAFRFALSAQQFQGAAAWMSQSAMSKAASLKHFLGWILRELVISCTALVICGFSFVLCVDTGIRVFHTIIDWMLECNANPTFLVCAGVMLSSVVFVCRCLARQPILNERVRDFSVDIQRAVVAQCQTVAKKVREAHVVTHAWVSVQIQKLHLRAEQGRLKHKLTICLAVAIVSIVLLLVEAGIMALENYLRSRNGHITLGSTSPLVCLVSLVGSLSTRLVVTFDSIEISCARVSIAIFSELRHFIQGPCTSISTAIFAILQRHLGGPGARFIITVFKTLREIIPNPYVRVAIIVWAFLKEFAGSLILKTFSSWKRATHNSMCSSAVHKILTAVTVHRYLPFGRVTLKHVVIGLMTTLCSSIDLSRYNVISGLNSVYRVTVVRSLFQTPSIALRTALVANSTVQIMQNWRYIQAQSGRMLGAGHIRPQRNRFVGWFISTMIVFCLKATSIFTVSWLAWPHVTDVWDLLVVVVTVLCILANHFSAYLWESLPVGVQEAALDFANSAPVQRNQRILEAAVDPAKAILQTMQDHATDVWNDLINAEPFEEADNAHAKRIQEAARARASAVEEADRAHALPVKEAQVDVVVETVPVMIATTVQQGTGPAVTTNVAVDVNPAESSVPTQVTSLGVEVKPVEDQSHDVLPSSGPKPTLTPAPDVDRAGSPASPKGRSTTPRTQESDPFSMYPPAVRVTLRKAHLILAQDDAQRSALKSESTLEPQSDAIHLRVDSPMTDLLSERGTPRQNADKIPTPSKTDAVAPESTDGTTPTPKVVMTPHSKTPATNPRDRPAARNPFDPLRDLIDWNDNGSDGEDVESGKEVEEKVEEQRSKTAKGKGKK